MEHRSPLRRCSKGAFVPEVDLTSFWKLEAGLRKVGLVAEYVAITGDLSAGVLLSQLTYWFRPTAKGKTKLTIIRDGQRWLAKSRSELQEECGLTAWKYRRAMDRLKDLGLVEVEVHLFQGKTTPHILLHEDRLLDMVVSLLDGEARGEEFSQPGVMKPHDRSGENLTTACEETSTPYQAENTAENTAEITFAARCAAGSGSPLQLQVGMKEDPKCREENYKYSNVVQVDFRGEQVKASDFLKNHQLKKEQPALTGKGGTSYLVALWKKRMSVLYPGEFVKGFTGKELGQMKQYAAATGPERVEVLDWVLQNWGTFGFEVKIQKGSGGAPERPVLGYLLKFVDVAVNAHRQSIAKATKPTVNPVTPQKQMVEQKHPNSTSEPLDNVANSDDILGALKLFSPGGSGGSHA